MKGTPEVLNIGTSETNTPAAIPNHQPTSYSKLDDPGFGWSAAVFDVRNYGREACRQPPVADDEETLFHEPGRILPSIHDGLGGTDCRSHCFKIVKPRFGDYTLIVHHGGGIERVSLGYSRRIVNALTQMDSDSRFRLMWTFLDVYHEAKKEAADATAKTYRQAFVEDRLKKRKLPARGVIKVWIEPPQTKGAA